MVGSLPETAGRGAGLAVVVADPSAHAGPDRFKAKPSPADVNPMSVHPDNLTWTQSEVPIRVVLDDDERLHDVRQ